MSYPWRDEDILRKLYHDKGMSQKEIANQLDCGKSTVGKWMRKHGIERRHFVNLPMLAIYEYFELEKSIYKVADEYDCSPSAVKHHIERNGYELRSKSEAGKLREMPDEFVNSGAPEWVLEEMRSGPANLTVNSSGHVVWRAMDGNKYRAVSVHQLMAISEGADPHKLFSGGKWHVHHKNGIPWDNRPENLQVMEKGEHHRLHNTKTKI